MNESFGMQPELISDARKAGYDSLSTDDLVTLHNHGVNGEYLKRLYAGGLKNLSVDQSERRSDGEAAGARHRLMNVVVVFG